MTKLYCEVCGIPIRDKVYIVEIENAILRVCKNCAKLGKVLRVVSVEESEKALEEAEKERKGAYEIVYEYVPNYNELIKREREKRGLTQRQLAQMLGIKESLLHKIESGEAYPDEKLARKLEKMFNIKLMEKKKIYIGEEKAKDVEVTLGDLVEIEEE